MADNRKGTYAFQATDATREGILLRAGLCGPTGSGKTKTALTIATRMAEVLELGPVYVLDSENKSALRYAYSPRSRQGYKFKHVPMPEDDYSPAAYTAGLDYCEAQGAGVIVIDSFSHAWNGINGVLEQVDQVTGASRSKNTFSEGWKAMTPVHNRLVQRILGSGTHVIFTLRAKSDWIIQENERGKKEPMNVGLAPIQREGITYEPDLFFDMTVPENNLIVSKSRCDRLAPGEVVKRPGPDFADVIIEWIRDSEPTQHARTLGEAITVAVAEGVAAAEKRSPDAYKAAKEKLTEWCRSNGVSKERFDVALAQFKERIAAATGPKMPAHVDAAPPSGRPAVSPPTPPPAEPVAVAPRMSDEDRLQAIDEGREPAAVPAAAVSPELAHFERVRLALADASTEADVQRIMRAEWKTWPADSDPGRAFRSAVEGAMQRFHEGWTIEGARATAKAAEDAKRAAAAGGAPEAARAPTATTKTRAQR